MENQKPAPIIDGLTVYEIEVNGDDPRWSKFDPKRYVNCNETVRIERFPVKSGKRRIKYVLLSFGHDPTNRQVFDEIARRNLTRPDWVFIETVLDARSSECVDKPIVGICGVVQSDARGNFDASYVYEFAGGRYFYLNAVQYNWFSHCLFVAVVSEEPIF